jgi:uncharacterized protein YggE
MNYTANLYIFITVLDIFRESVTILYEKCNENCFCVSDFITHFFIEDEKAFCDSMLKKAIERAKREAGVVAQSTGVKITGIKNISPTCRKETPYPFRREMLIEAKIPETPIEAGDIAINATVNVVFYIE